MLAIFGEFELHGDPCVHLLKSCFHLLSLEQAGVYEPMDLCRNTNPDSLLSAAA